MRCCNHFPSARTGDKAPSARCRPSIYSSNSPDRPSGATASRPAPLASRPQPSAPLPKPPARIAPHTGYADEIAERTARISDNRFSQGALPVTEVGVEYAPNEYMTNARTVPASLSSPFSVTLTDLEPRAAYYYRAYVIAGGGKSVGETLSFEARAPEAPHVATGDATDIAPTEAQIDDNLFERLPAPPSEAGVEYASSPDMTGSARALTPYLASAFGARIKGLSSGQRYFYRAYAKSNDMTHFGDIREFTTPAPVSAYTGYPIQVTPTSAVIHNNAVLHFGAPEDISEVGVEYGAAPDAESAARMPAERTDARSAQFDVHLTGLELDEDAVCYYRAYAIVNGRLVYGKRNAFSGALARVIPASDPKS